MKAGSLYYRLFSWKMNMKWFVFIVIMASLSSCYTEVAPVFGRECYNYDRGDIVMELDSLAKYEMLGVHSVLTNMPLQAFLLNRYIRNESRANLILVGVNKSTDLFRKAFVSNLKLPIIEQREDSTGLHLLLEQDSVMLYCMLDPVLEDATSCYVMYSKDKAEIDSIYHMTDYYAKKFECIE